MSEIRLSEDYEKSNGLVFISKYKMSPKIISLILKNVDLKTLYGMCTLVCKLWYIMIMYDVWPQTISGFERQFNTNLLKNPSGTNGLRNWIPVGGLYYKNFKNEGCRINDGVYKMTKCFTSTETPGHGSAKVQIIDLQRELKGLTQDFMDVYQPKILISEWYGRVEYSGQRNPQCAYILRVCLFDTNFQPIRRCNCNYLFWKNIIAIEKDSFRKLQYVIKYYGQGVRYIVFDEEAYDCHITESHVELLYPFNIKFDHVNEKEDPYQVIYHKDCRNPNYCVANGLIDMFEEGSKIFTHYTAIQKYKKTFLK